MSYILDALRRADAERERGAVPGLHAQAQSVGGQGAGRDRRPLLLATAAASLLLAVVLLVIVFGPWRSQPTAVVVAPAPAPVVAASPVPVVAQAAPAVPDNAAVQAGPAPVAAVPRAEAAMPTRVAAPVVAVPPAVAVRVASQAAGGRVAVLAPKQVVASSAQGGVAPVAVEHYGPPLVAPVPAPAAKSTAIAKIGELPADVRASLPKLTPGGTIYSDTPSARMLILNGQIYHEGDKPAADTVLEQIGHKSAVLNFRGTRYEIDF